MTVWNDEFEANLMKARENLKGCSHFYFEAQTGRIGRGLPLVSNFYNYKLPGYMLYFVVKGITKAKIEANYFSYPRDFLLELDDFDME